MYQTQSLLLTSKYSFSHAFSSWKLTTVHVQTMSVY